MYVEFLDKRWVQGLSRKVMPGEEAELEDAEAQVLINQRAARPSAAPKGEAARDEKTPPATVRSEDEVEFEGRSARK